MIETEEQRRWWFANHPEYSWSNKGGDRGRRELAEVDDDESAYSPEDVDAYVDEQLKYETGPVAKFLESFKREFGTKGASEKGGQDQGRSTVDTENGWLNVAGFHTDGGGLIVPTWPSVDELLRLPTTVAKEIIQTVDRWLQNYPLLIDPNSLESHHCLPKAKEFIGYFLACDMDIEQFKVILRAADHRLKDEGVHTGKGRGGRWNEEWRQFIRDNPLTYTPLDKERVQRKYKEMLKKYRIDEKAILSPTKPKRR